MRSILPLISTPAALPRTGLALMAACGLSACQLGDLDQADKPRETKVDKRAAAKLYPEADIPDDLPPEARETNETARLLAGLGSAQKDDPLAGWRSKDFWKNYQKGADAIWAEFASKRGMAVRKWAQGELADIPPETPVLQPFGGPNLVFSHLMFPDAATMVLCGKEPCAEMPMIESLSEGGMAESVHWLRETMASMLQAGGSPPNPSSLVPRPGMLQGAVPLLMALAARTGHLVESVELMPVEDVPSEESVLLSQPGSACVLTLRTAKAGTRRIFYFQQDLADNSLPDTSVLLRFLDKQNRMAVVLHDTGYDLHRPESSRMRQFILNHAVAIVQDPSGVPHRGLDPAAWNLRAYGSYAGAPPEHREFDQPDLVAAYSSETARPQPLPFGAGLIKDERPAAFVVARPLTANVEDLLKTEVTPLTPPIEPAAAAAPGPLGASTLSLITAPPVETKMPIAPLPETPAAAKTEPPAGEKTQPVPAATAENKRPSPEPPPAAKPDAPKPAVPKTEKPEKPENGANAPVPVNG